MSEIKDIKFVKGEARIKIDKKTIAIRASVFLNYLLTGNSKTKSELFELVDREDIIDYTKKIGKENNLTSRGLFWVDVLESNIKQSGYAVTSIDDVCYFVELNINPENRELKELLVWYGIEREEDYKHIKIPALVVKEDHKNVKTITKIEKIKFVNGKAVLLLSSGDVYEEDGCRFLSWLRCGEHSNDNKLYSVVVGSDVREYLNNLNIKECTSLEIFCVNIMRSNLANSGVSIENCNGIKYYYPYGEPDLDAIIFSLAASQIALPLGNSIVKISKEEPKLILSKDSYSFKYKGVVFTGKTLNQFIASLDLEHMNPLKLKSIVEMVKALDKLETNGDFNTEVKKQMLLSTLRDRAYGDRVLNTDTGVSISGFMIDTMKHVISKHDMIPIETSVFDTEDEVVTAMTKILGPVEVTKENDMWVVRYSHNTSGIMEMEVMGISVVVNDAIAENVIKDIPKDIMVECGNNPVVALLMYSSEHTDLFNMLRDKYIK